MVAVAVASGGALPGRRVSAHLHRHAEAQKEAALHTPPHLANPCWIPQDLSNTMGVHRDL